MITYKAIFPGKSGDEIVRVYKTKGAAIREAKKHLAACEDCNTTHYAEVYEYYSLTPDGCCNRVRLIWEQEA